MKALISRGATGKIVHILVLDSASTTGAGKTGLTNTSFTCFAIRPGMTGETSHTVNSITTLGTFAGSATNCAIKEVDAVNMPGIYEYHFANNMLATGADQCVVQLRAAGACDLTLEVQLTPVKFLPGAGQIVEDQPSLDMQEAISIILAAVAGRTSANGNTFNSPNNGETRITVTTNANNERTSVTLNPASV